MYRILMYGAGVIGSIFGGKLAQSGQDVTFLARNERYYEIKKNGILLSNASCDKLEKIQVKVISTLEPNDVYDYIFVVMQNTQVDFILETLRKNKSKNIVFVVNTAVGYEKWIDTVGSERLLLGFPSAGGERKNGVIYYFLGKGIKRLFQTTTFGELNGSKSDRVLNLIHAFNKSGIPCTFSHDMDAWQKTHVGIVTNIANALYGYDCNNYQLGHSYNDVKILVKAIKESREVLRNCGIKPTPNKLVWMDFPSPLLTLIWSILLKTKIAEVTMAKHCKVAKSEMKKLQDEFDVLIEKSKIKTPNIDYLKKHLFK